MKLLKFVKSFDFFGEPIQFCLKTKPYQTSLYGGILTMIFVGVFISITFQSFFDLVFKNNLTSYTTDIYNFSPPPINFTKNNVKFAFTFSDPILNNETYFNVELVQYSVKPDNSGISQKYKFAAKIGKCNINDFDKQLYMAFKQISTNFSDLLCPLNYQDFYIQGKYSSSFFDYVSLKISKCQNSDSIKCVSDNEIKKVLQKNNNKIYFNVYFSNNIIDINNIDNYLTKFLDDRIYVLLDLGYYKEKNVYLTYNEVLTDSSIFKNEDYETINTYTYENNYDETSILINQTSGKIMYSTIYFRSNFLSKKQMRTVEKVTDYLGYIGGFWSGLYMIFSRIGKRYNRGKFLLKIAKDLYCFPREIKQFTNKSTTIMDFKDKIFPKKERRLGIALESSPDEEINIKRQNTFKSRIEEYIEHTKAKAKDYIAKNFSPKHFIKNYKMRKIIEKKAMLAMSKDTDIIHLLGKIKEIDKFKTILLDNNQRNLFEYMPKTKIRLENDNHFNENRSSFLFMLKSSKANRKSKKKSEEEFQLKDFYILYNSYKNMTEDIDPKRREINMKIIKTLEPDLLEIFKKENKKKIIFEKSYTTTRGLN